VQTSSPNHSKAPSILEKGIDKQNVGYNDCDS